MFCANAKYCTDTVSRTTEWVGKVGLIYMSDYGYASTNAGCKDNIWDNCVTNNWLSPSSGVYSTMTINEGTDEPPGIWVIYSDYSGNTASSGVWDFDVSTYAAISVRPALYLGSKVQIIGGNGNNEPYKLSVQSYKLKSFIKL